MTILYDKDSLQKYYYLPHWQQEAFRSSFKLK